MTAPDPLALALRRLRSSPATDAAGHDDAEDADALRSALRAAGWEVVRPLVGREALPERLQHAASLLYIHGGITNGERDKVFRRLRKVCTALAQQEPSHDRV